MSEVVERDSHPDTTPAPAPEGDATALLRAAVEATLREKLAEAMDDPLVCWFVLRSREERAQIVQAADLWMKGHAS